MAEPGAAPLVNGSAETETSQVQEIPATSFLRVNGDDDGERSSPLIAEDGNTAQPPSGHLAAPEAGSPVAPVQVNNDVIPDADTGLAQVVASGLSLASRSIHADDVINTHPAVAPAMHVATTFRYSHDPSILNPDSTRDEALDVPLDSHVYSRVSSPNTTRLEVILTDILGGPAVTYASGLAAFHAMLVHLNPRRIAIGGGYHGCHGVIRLLSRLTGLEQLELEDDAQLSQLQPGDVIHVETPLNPTGEARDLAYYRRRADELGCYLTVDATFGPPPLQDPFAFGVDIIMHSGTKYFGGHSDMLCGVLAVRPDHAAGQDGWLPRLKLDRTFMGNMMGSLEGWLGVRSLRTLELRVERQSANASKIVAWIASERAAEDGVVSSVVHTLQHASLQPGADDAGSWLRKQMPRGFGPVFALTMWDVEDAKRLPSKLRLFHHATSLGGVESLIEWRAMSDATVDRRLLRVSVGVENWEDLRDDLRQGFKALAEEKKEREGKKASAVEGNAGDKPVEAVG